MESNPTNRDTLGARTRKANTSPTEAPNGADGRGGAPSRRASAARAPDAATVASPAVTPGLPPLEIYPAIAIEDVQPQLDGGYWPIKRVVGDHIQVSADIFKEGHDLLQARVIYRTLDEPVWREEPMRPVENDRWVGSFRVDQNTRYIYGVLAFADVYGSWRADLQKRLGAAQDVSSELLEGQRIVEQAAVRCADDNDRGRLEAMSVTDYVDLYVKGQRG